MASLDELEAGEFGEALMLHAQQKRRHLEEQRGLDQKIPLTPKESMILARALMKNLNQQLAATPARPTEWGVKVSGVVLEEMKKRASNAANGVDPGRQWLGSIAQGILSEFGPFLEAADAGSRGELSTQEMQALSASAAKLLEQGSDFFAQPIDKILMPYKGALAKQAKDPKAVATARAKKSAMALWLDAKRKGWTAVQFHTELVRLGHSIAPDTVRKWLTSLRKTGTC